VWNYPLETDVTLAAEPTFRNWSKLSPAAKTWPSHTRKVRRELRISNELFVATRLRLSEIKDIGTMFEIEAVLGRQVLDSRGNPTVEVEVLTGCSFGRAIVPSGASTGSNEALELRDHEKAFGGKTVMRAVNNVNTIIADELVGMDVRAQRSADRLLNELDGTPNKSNLGANAILGVSMAVARAAANSVNMHLYEYLGGPNVCALPVPLMNVINGGAHAANELSVQEFFIIPIGAETFPDALRMGVETYTELKRVLQAQFGAGATNVGDEGGFAPPLDSSSDALDAITNAVTRAGYAEEMWLGIDCAASEFYNNERDVYAIDGQRLSAPELSDYYADLAERYPLKVIEDPFNEEAFDDFAKITSRLKGTTIVGDDLFVTNVQRLSKGISLGAANALLLKLNQIGTISEAFDAATLAFRNGYSVVVSHRSGETEDTTIADVSVALGSELIKTGAPARSERNAKYNQLLRIHEYLGDAASYQGHKMKLKR
jgi:enolase 1/2/3